MRIRAHHIDIEDSSDLIRVPLAIRARIQAEMIFDHKRIREWSEGRILTENEAAESWIRSGFAEKFAKHYEADM